MSFNDQLQSRINAVVTRSNELRRVVKPNQLTFPDMIMSINLIYEIMAENYLGKQLRRTVNYVHFYIL